MKKIVICAHKRPIGAHKLLKKGEFAHLWHKILLCAYEILIWGQKILICACVHNMLFYVHILVFFWSEYTNLCQQNENKMLLYDHIMLNYGQKILICPRKIILCAKTLCTLSTKVLIWVHRLLFCGQNRLIWANKIKIKCQFVSTTFNFCS